MKTVAELRYEIELGLMIYASNNHDIDIFFAEGWYIFGRSSDTPPECEVRPDVSHGEQVMLGGDFDENGSHIGGGVIFDDCYKTFEDLLADWPCITSQPVWSTAKTPERLRWDKARQEEYQRSLEAQSLKYWEEREKEMQYRAQCEGEDE